MSSLNYHKHEIVQAKWPRVCIIIAITIAINSDNSFIFKHRSWFHEGARLDIATSIEIWIVLSDYDEKMIEP